MFQIHPFEPTAANYAAITHIHNAIWDDEPTTPEQLRHEDEGWLPGYLYQRLIVDVKGRIVASVRYLENHWQYQPGKYDVEILVHPDHQGQGIGRASYAHVMAILAARDPKAASIVSGTREDQPRAVRFLERRGFKTIMRWARSRLDITQFDANRFSGVLDHVRDQGIEIASIQTLSTMDPDWQRKAYALDQVAGQDAPSPDPMHQVSFETYVENTFGQPGYLPRGCFAAIARDGTWAGITELSRTQDPQCFNTPWTAVHPNYRRRGVATALKLHAIRFAQEQGVHTITAANEENNPMYQINLALGFEPLPASLTLKKVITDA